MASNLPLWDDEWHDRVNPVMRTVCGAYNLRPRNLRTFQRSYSIFFHGHQIIVDGNGLKDANPYMEVSYLGFTNPRGGSGIGGIRHNEVDFQNFKVNDKYKFEVSDPNGIIGLDDFFAKWHIPILYYTEYEGRKDHPNHVELQDLHKSREYAASLAIHYKDVFVRPASYTEIRKVAMGCLAIWADAQIEQYGCWRRCHLIGGLGSRIQQNISSDIWNGGFKTVIQFMRAFLSDDNKTGYKDSRPADYKELGYRKPKFENIPDQYIELFQD